MSSTNAKGEFDWVTEPEPDDGPIEKPDHIPASYNPAEKFGWESNDITWDSVEGLNDWTGILADPNTPAPGGVPPADKPRDA